jgi:hypothetical protein
MSGINGRVLLEVWWLANRNPKECYDVVGSILGSPKDGAGIAQTLALVQEVRPTVTPLKPASINRCMHPSIAACIHSWLMIWCTCHR